MNESKAYIEGWIAKAEEDFVAINKLTDNEIVAESVVCFHCQQLAEKYLKAFLIAHNKDIFKTHNIEFLLSECKSIDNSFANINPENLSDFGVDIRYPDDIYFPSLEEVLKHRNIAFSIRELVINKLKDL